MPNAVNIRTATPSDFGPMAELLEALFCMEKDFCFDEQRAVRGLEMILASDQACGLVAETDGTIVGMCSGQLTISTAEGGPAVLVEDVVVRQGWRGQGIGKLLVRGVMRWAREQQASRLQLLTDRTNDAAIEFYKHTGWQQTNLICLRNRTI